jgi:hypothetical protein
MASAFDHNKGGENKTPNKSVEKILSGLQIVTKQPIGGSKAVSLATPEKITIPTEEICKMRNDMTKFMNDVNETNKLFQNELSGGTSKVARIFTKIPWIGAFYEKNRTVKTEELMKKIITTCKNNTDKVEANMTLLLKSGKDLKNFEDSLHELVKTIREEIWSISETEQVLNVLLERKNDTQIRETSEFVESFMDEKAKENEREKLIGQIENLATNAGSMYRMMGLGVINLRYVRQELLATGMSARWIGQPAVLLEGVATDALTAGKDTALTSQGILEITKRSVEGMKLAILGMQFIQENGTLSDKGVQTISNLADELENGTISLGLLQENGSKAIDTGNNKSVEIVRLKE